MGLNFASAQAATDNYREEFSDIYYDCISGEDVQIFGTIHRVDKNNFHYNLHGFGIGVDSQARYVLNEKVNFMQEENRGTFTGSIILNGLGKTPDTRTKVTAHYTVNANGDTVVDFYKFEGNCD